MNDKHDKNIALVLAYEALVKSITLEVKEKSKDPDVKKELATKLNIVPITFWRRLDGATKPWTIDELFRLVKALKKPADTLEIISEYKLLIKSIKKDIQDSGKDSKMKQSFFADQLGLTHVTFWRRMNGKKPWTGEELIKLIKALKKIEKLNS